MVGSIDSRDRRHVIAFRLAEYVTWQVDDEGNAFLGHYFNADQLREAVADLYARASGGLG